MRPDTKNKHCASSILFVFCSVCFLVSCDSTRQSTSGLVNQSTHAEIAPTKQGPTVLADSGPYGAILYSAKPDENHWFGPAFIGGKFYDTNKPEQYEPSQNSIAASKWKTHLVDDAGSSSLEDTLVYCDGTFGKLAVTHKKAGREKGKFPWSYDISLLQLTSDKAKKPVVLVGSDDLSTAEDIKESHSTADGIKNLKDTADTYSGHSDDEEETQNTEIGLVSIIENDISLQRVVNGMPFGASHSWYERKWETYVLAREKDEIGLKRLDNSIFSDVLRENLNKTFDEGVELGSDFPSDDTRWDNFVLVPAPGGAQVVFGVAAVATEVHGTVIEIPGGKFEPIGEPVRPEISDGQTIALSPDKQIAIARDGDKIVCRFKTSKQISVMPASSFRGWSWVPLNAKNEANWHRFRSN